MTLDTTRERLERKLLALRPAMLTNEQFFTGQQPLAFLDPEVLETTKHRLKPLNSNLCRLAVEAVASRLAVTGFRSSPGEVVDQNLMDVWQRNGMDEQSDAAHLDALTFGRSFVMVWRGADGDPTITAESPLQVVVERDPLTRQVVAALKRWQDLDGTIHALLLTPTDVAEYVSPGAEPLDPLLAEATLSTLTLTAMRQVRRDANPFGIVPVVPIVNRPRLQHADGTSDLDDLQGLVQALGKLLTDALVASEFAAAPRRWVTGLAPSSVYPGGLSAEQRDALTDSIRESWENARASKFVAATSEESRFGAFPATDLAGFDTGVKLILNNIAALASLPPYWLDTSTASPTSADAIRAGESRLTRRVEQRQRWFSGSWEDVMRLAVRIRDGRPDPRLDDLQVIWRDAAPATIAQTADAQSKLLGAGITDRRAALEALGMTPLEIDRVLTSAPTVEVL